MPKKACTLLDCAEAEQTQLMKYPGAESKPAASQMSVLHRES